MNVGMERGQVGQRRNVDFLDSIELCGVIQNVPFCWPQGSLVFSPTDCER